MEQIRLVLHILGAVLALYAIIRAFETLFGSLPPACDHHVRTVWEICNWLVGVFKYTLMATIGFTLIFLI